MKYRAKIHELGHKQKHELRVSKLTGLDGLKSVAQSVSKGFERVVNYSKELLDEQYKITAISLIEETIASRWDCMAQGNVHSAYTGKDVICQYYCNKLPNCIDPHSKFRCPIYLITGQPKCISRPFYTKTVQSISKAHSEILDSIEYQIEFLSEIVLMLDPKKRSSIMYAVEFCEGDVVSLLPQSKLSTISGVLKGYNSWYHPHYNDEDLSICQRQVYPFSTPSKLEGANFTIIFVNEEKGYLTVSTPNGDTYNFPMWAFLKQPKKKCSFIRSAT